MTQEERGLIVRDKAGLLAALVPAPVQVMAIELVRILDFARTYNVAIPDREGALAIYRESLADLPTDLLGLAVERIVKTWAWGNRLPMPADIRALVVDDLARRKLAMVRLTMLERQAARQPMTKPLSPEDRAKVRELIDGAGRARVVTPSAETVTAPTPEELAEVMQACGVSAEEVLTARSPGR